MLTSSTFSNKSHMLRACLIVAALLPLSAQAVESLSVPSLPVPQPVLQVQPEAVPPSVSKPASVVNEEGVILISNEEYNHFVLPAPFQKVIFPPNSPIKGKPIPLAGNRSFLLQPKSSSKDVIQMIVQLTDGRVKMLRLKTAAIAGVTHRVDGALDVLPTDKPEMQVNTPHADTVAIFKQFTMGPEHVPSSFTQTDTPAPVYFETFTAKPVGAWTDGYRRMLVFELESVGEQDTVLTPPQFYRRGVLSVEIDGGDVVAPGVQPLLYILTEESLWTSGG